MSLARESAVFTTSAAIQDYLTRRGQTLAVAESVTVGHLQVALGAVSGASAYFLGGVTAYDLERKARLLGVDRATAAACDCVSEQVAQEMARGVRRLFGADFACATTGYAETAPARGVDEPFAWFAIESPDAARSGRLVAPRGPRIEVQSSLAAQVLKQLVTFLHD